MPTAPKRQPPPAPLIQITWITKKKGRTRAAVITLGSPVLAILLLLGGPQFS